ncbi:MAG: leucyl aminopeptidase family protein [Rhodospirillales bacterium]|nr:leucyl aminopeptidase family protein [Rhodospirillales bacterium]
MRETHLIEAADSPIPITPVGKGSLERWLAEAPAAAARWVTSTGFTADAGQVCVIPDREGAIGGALLGVAASPGPWDWSAAAEALPPGAYRIDAALDTPAANAAALGWGLACYHFGRYRARDRRLPDLLWPPGADRTSVTREIEATWLVRDLINTPAADMGPAELAGAALAVADRHGARAEVIVGDDLLAHNYPMIHAVGRASSRPPRLVDLVWGEPGRPKVTLVGKGVCFDSGGLDLKPSSAMKLMKKDMGGAAIVVGLAQMLMAAHLPIRLRVLIPAVENSVGGNAMRPLDVIRSRSGRTVEIGNTDAEGRLILADALAEAASEQPALLIDCATLTGAARVAVGSELPAVFTTDDTLAAVLITAGEAIFDPVWRLPLWPAYRRHLDSAVADVNSAPDHPFAGAILAALFLEDFIRPTVPWMHLDVMAWNLEARPGRPKGGEAMGMRALNAMIAARFGATP